MRIEDVARVCHEANRAFCQTIGDASQLPWEEAPEWQKASAVASVQFTLGNLAFEIFVVHPFIVLCGRRRINGPVKDADKNTHPCLVPYEELPIEQQIKDHLFRSVAKSLGAFL
jgi:hypothetical protein